MKKLLEEVKSSLTDAIEKAEAGVVPLQELYMLAPLLYSEKRNTRNEVLLQAMIDAADEQVAMDWSRDENSKYQYKFHFVSSYLYCFVVAGKMDEMKYDKVMEYVCAEMDLFTEDYTGE